MGLVLICSAVFTLKGTSLIVALTVGGILIIISWGKRIFNVVVNHLIQSYVAEKQNEEIRQLHERESVLKQQLEEYRNRKLQVLNIQPIRELGILEADCKVSQCFDLLIDKDGQIITEDTDKEPNGLVSAFLEGFLGQRRKRFIGTYTVEFPARYGIDMQNLKIRRDDYSKTVYVEGAEPSCWCGFPEETRWEGCVTLREEADEKWIADNETANLESPCKDMCQTVVRESLKHGPEQLNWLKPSLQNMVKHLLQMMIVPPGYSLVLVDKIDGDSLPFFEYAAKLGLDKPQLYS
jgi:hypothetical protein